MKRIKVAPKKFVMVNAELAEKADGLNLALGITKQAISRLATLEPKSAAGPMLGNPRSFRLKRKTNR